MDFQEVRTLVELTALNERPLWVFYKLLQPECVISSYVENVFDALSCEKEGRKGAELDSSKTDSLGDSATPPV